MAHSEFPKISDTDSIPKDRFSNVKLPEPILGPLQYSESKRKRGKFKAFLNECRSSLVKEVFLECGAVEVNLKEDWILSWIEGNLTLKDYSALKPFQKINHFPGMSMICKKDLLAHHLKRMKKCLPREYNFFPLTFCLPKELRNLTEYCKRRKHRDIFIIKPDTSCQGVGIELIKGVKNYKKYRDVVCQKYICKPFLMENFKMDLRLYVLITSVIPLRIYLYKEGLVRLATIPYKKPCLTNLDLENYFSTLGLSISDTWAVIEGIIVKTVLSVIPDLQHIYRTTFPCISAISSCYEVLGFDILLNEKSKPYLLEVNRSPSFGASTKIDQELKENLIRNVLNMIFLTPKQINLIKEEERIKSIQRLTNISTPRCLTPREKVLSEYQEHKENQMCGNFKKIYPVEDNRYDNIYETAFNALNF